MSKTKEQNHDTIENGMRESKKISKTFESICTICGKVQSRIMRCEFCGGWSLKEISSQDENDANGKI